jgi:hypothetical protein
MFSILALALLGQAAPPAIARSLDPSVVSRVVAGPTTKADEWHDLQYLGRVERGVFVMTATRARPVPIANYGLDLTGTRAYAAGEVRGNDPALRRVINDALAKEKETKHPVGVGQQSPGQRPGTHPIHTGPCPGPGPCPNPTKPDRPLIPIPDPFAPPPPRDPMDHLVPVLIAIASTVVIFGGFVLFCGGVAYLLTRHRKPPVP